MVQKRKNRKCPYPGKGFQEYGDGKSAGIIIFYLVKPALLRFKLFKTISRLMYLSKADLLRLKADLLRLKADLHGGKTDLHEAKADLHKPKADLQSS